MVYSSADWHIGHANIIKYCKRPFDNTDQMDDEIFSIFQKTIKPGDDFCFLGDLGFGKNNILKALNIIKNSGVKLHFIAGNHDKKYRSIIKPFCETYQNMLELKVVNKFVILCHYAIQDWNGVRYGSYHLHGHSHNTLPVVKNRYDVGVDATNYELFSLERL